MRASGQRRVCGHIGTPTRVKTVCPENHSAESGVLSTRGEAVSVSQEECGRCRIARGRGAPATTWCRAPGMLHAASAMPSRDGSAAAPLARSRGCVRRCGVTAASTGTPRASPSGPFPHEDAGWLPHADGRHRQGPRSCLSRWDAWWALPRPPRCTAADGH